MKKKKLDKEIVRFNPDFNCGLSDEQVKGRKEDKLTNVTKAVVGKTYWQIIATNVFSFFNILLFIIAGLMIYSENYTGLFFMFVLVPNMVIGLYEDIKARRLMDKLRVVTAPKVNVIRNGKKSEISTSDIVLDDIVYLSANNQICADSIVLDGTVAVNESLLTGEPDNIYKKLGDTLYSGSYIVSGKAYARVDKVGEDSYIESVQGQAKKFKRATSEILHSLQLLFRGVGVIVLLMAAATLLVYYFKGQLDTAESFKETIKPLSGSLVSMIPSGLYLLTSMALAVGVISLARKQAQVQDFYSIEMLSRTDVLCVDKTGTITDGTMQVKEVIPLNNTPIESIEKIMSNIIRLIHDENQTAKALLDYFTLDPTMAAKTILPFDSKNKYSGVTLKSGKTYIFGAAEFLNLKSKASILTQINEYSSKGYRVLVLGESSASITNNKFNDVLSPLAIIIIQDHIKKDAYDTFKWFKDNNVMVKVISGDNAATVSEIARQAGIENSEKYISLEGKTTEEVKKLANEYTVFGRVTPEQKAAIIESIKEAKHTVAMTGDGVNDILALKKADCSIAMASGADSARNVSHIVLLDSNFAHLPEVVAEGRRVVNNLQRTCSLFLVKTTFAMIMTIAFLIASCCSKDVIHYPFSTNNMYIWELITIGLSSFFLALEKNSERIEGKFLSNIFKKAIPAGLIVCLITGTFFALYFIQNAGLAYFGINTLGFSTGLLVPISGASAMAMISFTLFSCVSLGKVCFPLDKYRKIVFFTAIGAVIVAFVIFILQSLFTTDHNNLIRVNFYSLSLVNWATIITVTIIFSAIYLFMDYLAKEIKSRRGNKNDKNKTRCFTSNKK